LLDFCFSGPALQLYRRLCRHYFASDPASTAFYIDVYRDMWDSNDEPTATVAMSKRQANRVSRRSKSGPK
jgi:hypothetical protein